MKRVFTAAQVMTQNVLSVPPEMPVDELIEFLTNHSISGAPVVSADGKLIGVVSLTDVARNGALGEKSTEVPSYYRQGLDALVSRAEMASIHVSTQSETTVRDIMTPMVFSVDEAATAQEIAEAMITGRIHRVFVTRAGKMVGVISSMDMLPLIRDM